MQTVSQASSSQVLGVVLMLVLGCGNDAGGSGGSGGGTLPTSPGPNEDPDGYFITIYSLSNNTTNVTLSLISPPNEQVMCDGLEGTVVEPCGVAQCWGCVSLDQPFVGEIAIGDNGIEFSSVSPPAADTPSSFETQFCPVRAPASTPDNFVFVVQPAGVACPDPIQTVGATCGEVPEGCPAR